MYQIIEYECQTVAFMDENSITHNCELLDIKNNYIGNCCELLTTYRFLHMVNKGGVIRKSNEAKEFLFLTDKIVYVCFYSRGQ